MSCLVIPLSHKVKDHQHILAAELKGREVIAVKVDAHNMVIIYRRF